MIPEPYRMPALTFPVTGFRHSDSVHPPCRISLRGFYSAEAIRTYSSRRSPGLPARRPHERRRWPQIARWRTGHVSHVRQARHQPLAGTTIATPPSLASPRGAPEPDRSLLWAIHRARNAADSPRHGHCGAVWGRVLAWPWSWLPHKMSGRVTRRSRLTIIAPYDSSPGGGLAASRRPCRQAHQPGWLGGRTINQTHLFSISGPGAVLCAPGYRLFSALTANCRRLAQLCHVASSEWCDRCWPDFLPWQRPGACSSLAQICGRRGRNDIERGDPRTKWYLRMAREVSGRTDSRPTWHGASTVSTIIYKSMHYIIVFSSSFCW